MDVAETARAVDYRAPNAGGWQFAPRDPICPPMQNADRMIDLTDQVCPMTFVRTRLALDAMAQGQTLLIKLRGAEPRERVPHTLIRQGHAILDRHDSDGVLHLLVRKG